MQQRTSSAARMGVASRATRSSMMQRFGKVTSYEEWCQPRLVANALQLAQKELPRLRGKARSVHLSFATDAFMYLHPEVTAADAPAHAPHQLV